jgi:protein ImuB
MPVAEAVAVNPQLLVEEEDPEKDLLVLQELAEWATRYSPIVGLEEGPAPQSLLLDITGCAGCFHGEDRLAERATRELKETGWFACVAIADTIGAAWAIAHYSATPRVIVPQSTEKALLALPISSLRLPAQEVQSLAGLGVERVGSLAELPRAGIAARFSTTVLQRLDQALGRLPEVIVPERSMPQAQAAYSLDYPTDRLDVLNWVMDRLVQRLQAILENRNQGARQVECWLYQERREPLRVEVFLFRPSRSSLHIGNLLRIRLEQLRLDDAVNAMRLRVLVAESLVDSQTDFLDAKERPDEKALSALIDHLSSRLGPEVVARAVLVPDPQPEYASRFEPVIRPLTPDPSPRRGEGRHLSTPDPSPRRGEGRHRGNLSPRRGEGRHQGNSRQSPVAAHHSPLTTHHSHRPLRLWPLPQPVSAMSLVPDGPPLRFRWQGRDYRVVHAWGPERIEAGWWRGPDVHRDYYVVATHLGTRFWLFRRHEDGRWFLHGCFD